VAKKSPRLDDTDVALTRARTEIAELQAKVTRIESDFEVLERRILSLEAREAQRAHDRAWAQQNYQAQALQQLQNYQAQQSGMQQNYPSMQAAQAQAYAHLWSEDMEEYIRNCTPGRAGILRRQR
jgi:chromosome segregation ATPase